MRIWRVILAVLLLTAGCSANGAVGPGGGESDDSVHMFNVTWRRPWPPLPISEESKPPNLFTRKLPVDVILIRSASGWSGSFEKRSRCNIDTDDFESHVERNLESRGIDANPPEPAPLILHVDVDLIDAPRGSSEVPEFCYMTVWTRLVSYSTQSVSWAPEKEFTAEIEFFEHSTVFRSQPENMRAEFEKVIDWELDLIQPLLLGELGAP